jgi:hypothetical protein
MMNLSFVSLPAGNLLYLLTQTGPVVPSRSGDDQELEAERETLWTHSVPRCALLRVRGFLF